MSYGLYAADPCVLWAGAEAPAAVPSPVDHLTTEPVTLDELAERTDATPAACAFALAGPIAAGLVLVERGRYRLAAR